MAKKAKQGAEKELDEDLDEGAEDESEDEGDEEEAPKAKSKKAKSKGKDKKAAKAKSKDEDEDDGFISIGDLAEEAEINAQSARVKLREAELEKPEGGRWRWKEGSKALKAARKALGLAA